MRLFYLLMSSAPSLEKLEASRCEVLLVLCGFTAHVACCSRVAQQSRPVFEIPSALRAMTVAGLWQLLRKKGLVREVEGMAAREAIQGQKVAVDISTWVVQGESAQVARMDQYMLVSFWRVVRYSTFRNNRPGLGCRRGLVEVCRWTPGGGWTFRVDWRLPEGVGRTLSVKSRWGMGNVCI